MKNLIILFYYRHNKNHLVFYSVYVCACASLFVQHACICFTARAILIISNFICILVIHSRLVFCCIYFVFHHLVIFSGFLSVSFSLKLFLLLQQVDETTNENLVNVSIQRFRWLYPLLPSSILIQLESFWAYHTLSVLVPLMHRQTSTSCLHLLFVAFSIASQTEVAQWKKCPQTSWIQHPSIPLVAMSNQNATRIFAFIYHVKSSNFALIVPPITWVGAEECYYFYFKWNGHPTCSSAEEFSCWWILCALLAFDLMTLFI